MLHSAIVGFGALGSEVTAVMICAAGAFTLALALCLRRPKRSPLAGFADTGSSVHDASPVSNVRSS